MQNAIALPSCCATGPPLGRLDRVELEMPVARASRRATKPASREKARKNEWQHVERGGYDRLYKRSADGTGT